MRKYAILKAPINTTLHGLSIEVKKVLYYINEMSSFAIIYVYNSCEDTFGIEDYLYQDKPTITEIEKYCLEKYTVKPKEWLEIPDPEEFCNVDFIIPTRRKGRDKGIYYENIYEQWINGQWIKIDI